eukprot:m.148412 g.148412  ORF g.148412 m.148412 type:complete len:328 (+) comp13257_c3_seq2:235-1218(+)
MEKKEEERRKGVGDPGNKTHGNFPFYYQFNPVSARLSLLEDGPLSRLVALESNGDAMFCDGRSSEREEEVGHTPPTPLCLLDIGCNSGDLTMDLAHKLHKLTGRPVHAEGWDIDEELVEQARTKLAADTNRKSEHNSREDSVSFEFHTVNVANTEDLHTKSSKTLKRFAKKKYDLVCLFSVTMWIHVHSGDEEFLDILGRICDLTDALIVEPQESRSYGTCRRRMKRAGGEIPPKLDELKLRGDKLFPAIQKQINDGGFYPLQPNDQSTCTKGVEEQKTDEHHQQQQHQQHQQQQQTHVDKQPSLKKAKRTAWKRPIWLFRRRSNAG